MRMATLVFLRRTAKEVEVFGGDVYFDIDGKNVGMLSGADQEIHLEAGLHTIRMYKSHTYGTFIGFAETTIMLSQDESLMVRYASPVTVNQPGNIIITTYNFAKEEEVLAARDNAISRDFESDVRRKQEQNEKYNTGVKIWIACIIIGAIIFAIWEASIWW